MKESKIFGPADSSSLTWLGRAEQVDRYEAHTKNCVSCSEAFQNAQKVNKYSILLALIPLALNTSSKLRVLGVLLYLISKFLSEKVIRATTGPVLGEATSAAQFPLKKDDIVKSMQ